MKQNIGFRGWFYFRQGWTTYFAFIFAAVNTMVVTYYLAIENIPTLKTIFPTFYVYLAITASLGIPILIFVGYAHQKKTASYKAEADIYYESNPHALRTYNDVELLLRLNLNLVNFILEREKNNVSNEKLDNLIDLRNEIETYFKQRKDNKQIDIDYFKRFSNIK
jgi:predicted RNA-binding protein